MQKITVVPLGPGAREHLTLGALEAFECARTVILRTGRHGACGELEKRDIKFATLDALYEECSNFDALNARAAQTLWEAAASGPLAYGVADPAADETVRELMATAGSQRQVTVMAGWRFIRPACAPCRACLSGSLCAS